MFFVCWTWQCHLWPRWGVNHGGGGGEGRLHSSRRLQINGNYHLDTSTLITEQDQGQGARAWLAAGPSIDTPGIMALRGPRLDFCH